MPTVEIYLPEDVYERLRDAAKALRLNQKAFMRAILIAAVTELERTEGRILPGDQPASPSQPVRNDDDAHRGASRSLKRKGEP